MWITLWADCGGYVKQNRIYAQEFHTTTNFLLVRFLEWRDAYLSRESAGSSVGVNRSPGMGPRAPGSVGVVHAAGGEPESGGPVTGVAALRWWRDAVLASFRRRLEGFGRPARLRVLRLRSAALSLRGNGVSIRVGGAPPGASRGAAAAGLTRALEAVPEAPSGCFQAASIGMGPPRSSPRPGQRFRRMWRGLPWGLPCRPRPTPAPKASDVGLPVSVERGRGPVKGSPILSRSAPYRQVRRHRPRRGDPSARPSRG